MQPYSHEKYRDLDIEHYDPESLRDPGFEGRDLSDLGSMKIGSLWELVD